MIHANRQRYRLSLPLFPSSPFWLSLAVSLHCSSCRKFIFWFASHDSYHNCDDLKTIVETFAGKMHPPLTLHRHPMCAEIIEEFQKCHLDHPIAKFFGECTELKIKLDRCFRQEKALKRKANFEQSKKLKERLQALRKENAENDS
ncbi:hypothetical protein CRYUN_Cryun02cG0176500 [Craigia yunnanensis]